MSSLGKIAKYVRSKNAGPFAITIDVFFEDRETFELARSSGSITKAKIGELYAVPEKDVLLFFLDSLLTVKISMPRPRPQGNRAESDMHAGQQFVRILGLPFPDGPAPNGASRNE